jgi:hypothetical protein
MEYTAAYRRMAIANNASKKSGLTALQILHIFVLVSFYGLFFANTILQFKRISALDNMMWIIRGSLTMLGYYCSWPLAMYCILMRLASGRDQKIVLAQIKLVAPFFLFVIYLVVQALLSPAMDVANVRLIYFLTNIGPLFLLTFSFSEPKQVLSLRLLYIIWGLLACVFITGTPGGIGGMLVDQSTSISSAEAGRFGLGWDPITSGMFCYMTVISIILFQFSQSTFRWRGIWLWIVALFLTIVAFQTGSRGPAMAFVASILMIILLAKWKFIYKVLVLTAVCMSIILGFLIAREVSPTVAERFERLSKSDSVRFENQMIVWENPPDFFGHGVGTFSRFSPKITEGDYIHNCFLEAYFETGYPGIVLLLVVLVVTYIKLIKAYRKSRNPALLFCLAGLTFYLAEAQFTASLFQLSGLYVFMMIGSWLPATVKMDQTASNNI